ncbi:FAD-dependent oxidoreductase [Massilia glaciei]|uniref:FAD-dependent oxidoreductase n=1 Tax=Massilia glaciei TaxID=1524097 RepID=A0A2U2HLY1_9BURK|nr:FAD-dependent oxidoreductase [Massilia glaciei]PWF48479.1 FAD-dependent oxidoreductase [Massilia glaciei]
MQQLLNSLPVAVIGAGPVGLAAAAHLLRAGFTPLVLEAGTRIADNLESYRHVRMFSPWRYNLDRAAVALLAQSGWRAPDADALPTAGQIVDGYLAPLAALPALAGAIRLGHSVRQVSRQGHDKVQTRGRGDAPFVLQVDTPAGAVQLHAQAIIDASGTWSHPNPLGANGLPAQGESEARARIAHGMPDILGGAANRYAGKRVLVIGAGHSAAGNLIALAELAGRHPATTIVWVVRGGSLERLFGGGAADQLPARGALGARLRTLQANGQLEVHLDFRVREMVRAGGTLQITGEARADGTTPVIARIDQVIGATGGRPDLSMTRELRVRLDPWLESTDALAPLIDPNMHSCGTVRPHGHRELAHPEQGYYAVGAKSYGRAPNFLMATGYEQVRSIVAALAGDLVAADDVRLELPETGVCSSRPVTGAAAACCGGPAPEGGGACCVADADA